MADRIQRFKKFTEMKKDKIEKVSPEREVEPNTDEVIDGTKVNMNPGAPAPDVEKIERLPSRKNLQFKDQNVDLDSPMPHDDDLKMGKNEGAKVKLIGRIAKLPNKTQASKGYNFLENVKISKNSIWYIMVERQDNELQMVKYNNKKGVDLGKFVKELKDYYIKKYTSDENIFNLIESIEVTGKNEFSVIKNIPSVQVDGKKLITKITEDLIKLLSK